MADKLANLRERCQHLRHGRQLDDQGDPKAPIAAAGDAIGVAWQLVHHHFVGPLLRSAQPIAANPRQIRFDHSDEAPIGAHSYTVGKVDVLNQRHNLPGFGVVGQQLAGGIGCEEIVHVAPHRVIETVLVAGNDAGSRTREVNHAVVGNIEVIHVVQGLAGGGDAVREDLDGPELEVHAEEALQGVAHQQRLPVLDGVVPQRPARSDVQRRGVLQEFEAEAVAVRRAGAMEVAELVKHLQLPGGRHSHRLRAFNDSDKEVAPGLEPRVFREDPGEVRWHLGALVVTG
mmetsp:Transcript_54080/g.106802  ORF Transcript_54080/g.106802 Transcript_54080/m.106802 type:complete len:287 (+) Transcript_54080:562-1422(+)